MFKEILYFPIWWYSQGFKKTALFCWQRIRYGWRSLALSILLANFFKPMYGQRGWDVYVLSLGVRSWQILWRIFLMAGWVIFWLAVLLVWLILPLFIIYAYFT